MFFPESPTDVTAEIHAEMDSEPNILQSPCSEEAEQVPKPKPERSFAAEIDFDEIFAIEDEIPWKIVSKNVEFYRIGEKQVITHFSSGPEAIDIDNVTTKQTVMEIDRDKRCFRSSSIRQIKNYMKNGLPKVVLNLRNATAVNRARTKIKRKITYDADDSIESKRMRKECRDEDDDELAVSDDNQENNDPKWSITSSDYGKQINPNKNMFPIKNKGESIKSQAKKPDPLFESNQLDAFDMICAGPSYDKGQLHVKPSFSYRTYSSTPQHHSDRVPNTSDSSDTDFEGQ